MTLIEFLLKEKILGLYVINIFRESIRYKKSRTYPLMRLVDIEAIGAAFNWQNSKEGHAFWYRLNNKFNASKNKW